MANPGNAQDRAPGADFHAARSQLAKEVLARLFGPERIVQEARRHPTCSRVRQRIAERAPELVVDDDVAFDEHFVPRSREVVEQRRQKLARREEREAVHVQR